MNRRIKIEYMEGEGALEVVDLRNSEIAATLSAAGDVFEQNMQGNAEFLVCGAGRAGIRRTPSAFGDATQQGGGRNNPQPDAGRTHEGPYAGEDQPLPPGAGEPGSSVEDVRVPESETAPSPSSDDTGSDRQAEYDAARTRNSPRGTI